MENPDDFTPSVETPVSKRPLEHHLAPKRVKLNTPDASVHNSSPISADWPQSSHQLPDLSRLSASTLGLFGMFNNPIIIGSPEKSELTAENGGRSNGNPIPMSYQIAQGARNVNVLSASVVPPQAYIQEPSGAQIHPLAPNQPLMAPNQPPYQAPVALAHVPGQDLNPVQYIPYSTVSNSQDISNIPLQVNSVTQPSNGPTKKQIERLEKQKQRELERLEREAAKEVERQLKKDERERKDHERQLKREQLEKDKERKREEEKTKREEKRQKMEEERKRKEEEKRQKEEERKQKDEERKLKEEDRRRREDQKERNQMKISSFFAVKPNKTLSRPGTPKDSFAESTSPEKALKLYSRQFLPFFIKQNVLMAPAYVLLAEELAKRISAFDLGMKENSPRAKLSALVPSQLPAKIVSYTSVQQLLEAFNSASTTEKQLHTLVENLPAIKYLQFYENSKPPYIGTWCSERHLSTQINQENPLETSLTGYDYNYDSDLDWQDGDDDEGEDIDDLEDGEDDDDEANDDDDMEDFVDDKNEVSKRRRPIGMLKPVSKWNYNTEEDKSHFEDIKYERLDYDIHFPIDPLCNYWSAAKVSVSVRSTKDKVAENITPVKVGNTITPNVLTPNKPAIKDARVVAELIKFVEKNSDFTIGTLSELAKKEFKSYTKSILKHTIQEVASYNKKKSVWEIKQTT